jgi:hypothetical protein
MRVDIAAGLRPLRFTHHQIRFEPEYVRAILVSTVAQIAVSAPTR